MKLIKLLKKMKGILLFYTIFMLFILTLMWRTNEINNIPNGTDINIVMNETK